MIKKLPKSKIEFELTVAWADWGKYLDQAAEEVSKEIKIPGFRPGKAPRNIVEQKVGKGIILNAAAEKAVQKAYTDFVTKEKLEVIGQPEIVIEKLEENKDFIFKAQVAVMPEVKLADKYKKAIKKVNAEQKEKKAEVNNDEIELEMEKLANSRVKLVTARRAAKTNDSVEIDFTVLAGGVPIEGGTSKNHPLIIGRGVFIPGFEDNIIGMQEGEEKEFELNFPADYHKKDLAGKLALFKVKMNLVQERQVPELNDEFAKSLGTFEDLAALKKNIQEGMTEEWLAKIKEQKRNDFIEKIIENSEIELPEILARGEIHQMMHEFEQNLAPMGMSLDQYLEKLKKDKKELEKDWEPMAEKRVKSALLLKEIAKLEEIAADSIEIEAEMNKTMQYYKNVKNLEKNIDMERLYNHVKGMLENEKVFEFLEKL
ncbi:MAG: trigger factor [Parcubacteria group bacterium]